MRRFIYFFLLCIPLVSFAQQKEIDSLLNVLDNHKTEDLDKFNIINDLAYYYHLIDPEEGLIRSDEAIALAEALGLKNEVAVALKNKANNLKQLNKESLALEMYDKSIEIQTELGLYEQIARTTFNKGLIYTNMGNFDKALECNVEAYDIFKKEQDSLLMAIALTGIGNTQTKLSLYPQAVDSHLEASLIYEQINMKNTPRHAETYTGLGIVYSRLGKYEKAIEYHQKCLNVTEPNGLEYASANAYTNMGNVYDNLYNPERALEYYSKALEIMKRIKNKFGVASALTNSGIAYTTLKDYDKALEYFDQTKVLFSELEDTYNLALVYESIGNAYYYKAEAINDPNLLLDARSNYNIALEYGENNQDIQRISSALKNLAQVNGKLQNYKTAFLSYERSMTLKDSILSTDKKKEIARLETQYEIEKREHELKIDYEKKQAKTRAEIEKQKLIKNASIAGGGTLAVATIISFLFYRRKQKAKAQEKEANFNLQVADTELKALRAQMNPHFIFNSLNSINDYISKNDTESATNYLTKFSKLMRETLEKSSESEILLEEDIQILKTYMEIENKRTKNKFSYSFDIEEDIEPSNTLVPPMILQPFIENSIIHGLSNIENGQITVAFRKKVDMLACSVVDNGIGRHKSHELKGPQNRKSLGVSITKSRLEIINRKKNQKGDLKITDLPNGTKVEVIIPLTLAY